eukprot:54711_1
MGNPFSVKTAPDGSTIIRQKKSWTWFQWYFSCHGPQIPRWFPQPPSQRLIQCGLSAQAMQQEIDSINATAVAYVNERRDKFHCYSYFAVVFIAAAAVLSLFFATNMAANIGDILAALFMIGGILAYAVNWCAWYRIQKLWDKCLNHIEIYIHNEVRPRYQTYGIVWSICSRRELIAGGRHKRGIRHYIRYNDICVTPCAAPMQVMQQPPVIYVDQHGNHVPPQQQVMFVNQNGVPIQNQVQMQSQTLTGGPGIPLQVLQPQPPVASAPAMYYEATAPPGYQ